MLILASVTNKIVEHENTLLGPKHEIHLLFVFAQVLENNVRKILACIMKDLPHRVKEEVVILKLLFVQPGHGGPDCHVHALHQPSSLLHFDRFLLLAVVELLMSQLGAIRAHGHIDGVF